MYIGKEKLNNQGCLMKIVEYISSNNIIVEFQDEYKYRVNTIYANFKSGSIKNPYYPSVFGVGITGIKYPRCIDCKNTKEYEAWKQMLRRCFSEREKKRNSAYIEADCCKEWLNYENFYEWLHKQPNFNKWYNGSRWALEKDIIVKKNKLYSPEFCCLVPQNVNCLFLKREAERGKYPIGVQYKNDVGFIATCRNPFLDKAVDLGHYPTSEKAFQAYKIYKESIIKQVAEVEYKTGNITKKCYRAMMDYEVEITD